MGQNGLKKRKLKSKDETCVHLKMENKSEAHFSSLEIWKTLKYDEHTFLFLISFSSSGLLPLNVLLSLFPSNYYMPRTQITLTGAVKLLIAEGLCFHQSFCTQMNYFLCPWAQIHLFCSCLELVFGFPESKQIFSIYTVKNMIMLLGIAI